MSDIRVQWRGGERTFGDEHPVRVGRSAECEVLVLDERVSRDPHLVLRFEGGVWILEDKSSGGTWSNGQRIQLVSIPGAHTFNLGAADGPELTVEPITAPATAPGPPAANPDSGATDAPVPLASTAPTDAAALADPGAALLAEAARLEADAQPAGPAPADPTSAPPAGAAAPGLESALPAPLPPTAPPPQTAPPSQSAPPPQAAPPSQAAPPPPFATPGPPRFDPSLTVSLDDRALRLSADDKELVIPPGYAVTIGRDPSCDLAIDNQIVSRQHARFTHDGTSWMLEDLGSTRGTFIDGKRVRGPQRAEGVFEISLGDDTAGEKVRVITAGEHTTPRNRTPLLIAVIAAVLALGGIVAAVAFSGGGGDTTIVEQTVNEGGREANSEDQLAAVKASTVLIEAVDRSGRSLWTGSGTVVTDEGHVLTNAHVADPGAESLDALVPLLGGLDDRSPVENFVIFVSPSEDEPAEPRYIAEWVASSETQDASIIQITGDYETGEPISDPALVPVPIGTSDDLRAGQKIHSLGYPSNATTFSISVLEGEVVSFVSADEFREIVGGDDRKVMNTSAVLGQGSSGGPIVRDGRIIGLNATLSTGDGLDRGWAIPIDEIAALLAEVDVPPTS